MKQLYMMSSLDIGKFLYFLLFLVNMMQPISAVADSSMLSPKNSIQDKSLESNSFDDCDAFPEDVPLLDELESKEPFLSFLDAPKNIISSGVESVAKSIDEFFSNDKVFYETSGTYLRLRASAVFNEGGDVGYEGKIRLKLRLPNTKRKLKFTFDSDANEKPDGSTIQLDNTLNAAVEKNDYFAELQATVGKKGGWQFRPSIGLRLSSSIKPYVKFRFKRKYELTKWSVNWHETPYWFDSFGWGFDSYLELNRKISKDDLFRASTFARWTNEMDKFELSQTFSMYHILSKRHAISYFVGVYGESEPTVYATHYLIGLTYRQKIHKDYLFVELIPKIKYDKTNNFQAEYSLTIRFEMIFKK